MYENLEIILDEKLLVGECPTWNEKTGELLFVDIRGNAYYKMDYATGEYQKYDVPQAIGCLALCENGDLLLSMEDGIYRQGTDGTLRLAHPDEKIKGERFNDGKVGPDGCYYVGTASPDFSGAFYRLSAEGLDLLFGGCSCSNGIDWSADKKILYYCDSNLHKLERFVFNENTHSLSTRETIMEIPKEVGVGDGMAIDDEGNIWLAIWGGSCLWHIDPVKGEIIEKLPIPAKQVSSCCFAGADLKDLIITTAAIRTDEATDPLAGRIFRYRAEVGGVITNRYRD